MIDLAVRRRFRLAAMTLLFALGSCDDPAKPVGPCSGDLNVHVTMGAQPVFGWTPACGVSTVVVSTAPTTPGAASAIVWAFDVPETDPVAPTIVYGVAPTRATVWHQPVALQPGARYQITVSQTVGGDVVVASGYAVFVDSPPD